VKDLTEIAVIRDRSGSMNTIKDDMEGGLWSLTTEQHGMPGVCRVSLYDFDHEWKAVFEAKPSGSITKDECRLVPRGNTALYDSVVKSLASLEARILAEPEDARPEFVFVVVITDGKDNASEENTRADANKATKRVIEKYGWKFSYLAAGPEAFEEGEAIGAGAPVAVVAFAADAGGTRSAYQSYSRGIADVRSRKADDDDKDN
jgi:hypothetical protein